MIQNDGAGSVINVDEPNLQRGALRLFLDQNKPIRDRHLS
jgi:hypothetical protein